MVSSSEIRKRFLNFFESRGHKIVPSSSLVPDDPSVLLTTAGMQQLKKYYTDKNSAMRDFGSLNVASIQKSFRTSDIDEVGDESHNTFFEMLGNFSFGGYFKEAAITYAHEFITKEMNLPISYVTVFKGSHNVPRDEESKEIWNSLGITDIREEGIEDVFWGPTGNEGPCGPTTEIYCKTAGGKDVEIWNIVFNQFLYPGSREELIAQVKGKKLEPLKNPGVDTGMGLERLTMIAQNKRNIFETDLFEPIADLLSGDINPRTKRIIADHARAICFLISDGVRPSNKGAGYVLRRLMRRYIVALGQLSDDHLAPLKKVVEVYGAVYPELKHDGVLDVLSEEKNKFDKTLKAGVKELEKAGSIDAKLAFKLYESYGLPYEVIKDVGGERVTGLRREDFEKEFAKHQELSRAGKEKKFGGHGLILDTGEIKAKDEIELRKVTRLHTATHLLQAALRKVLGSEVEQMGSDITAERTRFDFSFPRKLANEEIKKVEDLVNEVVRKALPMQKKEMAIEEAKKTGALFFFRNKYPEKVNVYFAGNSLDDAFSKEFCGGPHVTNTKEIGTFKILKEEAVSAGVRRIRADVD